MNGLLFATLLAVSQEPNDASELMVAEMTNVSTLQNDPSVADAAIADALIADSLMGERLELPHPSGGQKRSYAQWLEVLSADAKAMAAKNPEH